MRNMVTVNAQVNVRGMQSSAKVWNDLSKFLAKTKRKESNRSNIF